MTTREHSNLLGIFFLIHGGLQLFGGIIMILIYGGLGAAALSTARRSEEQVIGGIFLVVAIIAGFFILIFAALNFFAGWKLFKGKSGARILGIVASCICLLGFPLGTALGIYGLWFFFGDKGKALESEGGYVANNYPPPPPNNWQ